MPSTHNILICNLEYELINMQQDELTATALYSRYFNINEHLTSESADLCYSIMQ